MIYKSQPFVRNQGSWQLVWDLVHCLVKTAPTINHLRLLRVKLTTGIFFPSIQDHKKKNIQNNPRPLDLISAIGPEQAQATIGSSLGLGFRCSEVSSGFRPRFLSLNFFSPKNLEDTLKLDKFNFIQCFSSNPTTSTALGMKWSRSSSSH